MCQSACALTQKDTFSVPATENSGNNFPTTCFTAKRDCKACLNKCIESDPSARWNRLFRVATLNIFARLNEPVPCKDTILVFGMTY